MLQLLPGGLRSKSKNHEHGSMLFLNMNAVPPSRKVRKGIHLGDLSSETDAKRKQI